MTPIISCETICEGPTPYVGAVNRLERRADRLDRVTWCVTWGATGSSVGSVHEFTSAADAVEHWIRQHNERRNAYATRPCLDSIALVDDVPHYQDDSGRLFRAAIICRADGSEERRYAPAPAREAGLVRYEEKIPS